MNFLFLASWYPETPASRNGLFIWQHAAAMAKGEGDEVALVAAVAQPGSAKLSVAHQTIAGVQHWVASYPPGKNAISRSWRYLRALNAAVLAKEKATGKSDLFVVNVLWRAGILAWLYQLLLARPYIIIEHWSGYLPEGQGYKGFYLKYFTRLIVDRAERVLTVSSYLADSMRARGLMNRYHVLPNIVNTAVFRVAAQAEAKQPLRLLHVSNLAPEKNFDFVFQLWQDLRQLFPELGLQVAGAYTHADKQRYAQYPDIQWLGFQEELALSKLYQSATVLCMPSFFETFSIVIAEALACGCPVLASNLATFDFYRGAKNFHPLPLDNNAAWQATFKEIISGNELSNDFYFIHDNFSSAKVSKKMHSILDGIKL